MLKIFAAILMAILWVVPAVAETACKQEGMDACISFQFANLRHSDADEAMIRADETKGARTLLDRIKRGAARFDGRQNGGALFIWLKPEYANDPNFRIPAGQMREFRYDTTSPNPSVRGVTFNKHPSTFPELDDPRLPSLGVPHYVLVSEGGKGGLGWSMPAELVDAIAYVVYCPKGPSSYPNRLDGASMGIHFTPADIARWKRNDIETVFKAVLMVK